MQPLLLACAAGALLAAAPAATLADDAHQRPPRPEPSDRGTAPRPAVTDPARPPPPAPSAQPAPPDSAVHPGSTATPGVARPPPPDPSAARRPPPPGRLRPRPPGWYPGYPGPLLEPPWWWLGWGWAWGWGWGYEPYPPRPEGGPDPDAHRVVSSLGLSGTGGGGFAGGLAFGVEGPRAGARLSIDAISPDRIDHAPRLDQTDALGWGTLNATWALLAGPAGRLRLELGGSMLSIPATGSYAAARYGGTTVFGPDAGLSGELHLVGPLGLEAHGRVTPFPVPVVDAGLALALRGGPFAFTAGVRDLELSGTAARGPKARVLGPELGLALRL